MLPGSLFLQVIATSSLTALLYLQKNGCFLSPWISRLGFLTYPGGRETVLDTIMLQMPTFPKCRL